MKDVIFESRVLLSLRGGQGSRRAGFVGFVVDKAALGQVFSEHPCESFQQFLHHHNHPALA
jgi:hypothetical protein